MTEEAPSRTPEQEAKLAAKKEKIATLLDSITQREWLLITRALEARKDDVMDDSALYMPAICWVDLKRKHGGADWEVVLEMTDDAVMQSLGIADDDEPADDSGKAPQSEPPAGLKPPTRTESGDSTEPDSASPREYVQPTTTNSLTTT